MPMLACVLLTIAGLQRIFGSIPFSMAAADVPLSDWGRFAFGLVLVFSAHLIWSAYG